MDQSMDECMHQRIDHRLNTATRSGERGHALRTEWINGCFNAWSNAWITKGINTWSNEWIDECSNEWINEWINE
jgi:hypothetical protein